MEEIDYDFPFYDKDSSQNYEFIRIPKILNKQPFDEMSVEAKYIYGLFLDRLSCSQKNYDKFSDERGHLFIIYPREEIEKQLNRGKEKVAELIKELKKYKLIEEKKMGVGLPRRIYPKDIISKKYSKSGNPTYRSPEIRLIEVGKTATSNINSSENNIEDKFYQSIDLSKLKPGQIIAMKLGLDINDLLITQTCNDFDFYTKYFIIESFTKAGIFPSLNDLDTINEEIRDTNYLYQKDIFKSAIKYSNKKFIDIYKRENIKSLSDYYIAILRQNLKYLSNKKDNEPMEDFLNNLWKQ